MITEVAFDTATWDGRATFDGQTLADIYFLEASGDGVAFTPVPLTFTGAFTASTASAAGLAAQAVRIGLRVRTESSGNADQNVWSSQILENRLTTAVPEPASAGLVAAGLLAIGSRRRRAGR